MFVTGVCSIRVVQWSSVYKSTNGLYLFKKKLSYQDSFVIQLVYMIDVWIMEVNSF